MSVRSDRTRWNRSGLSRIGYVDGSAPLFLESIRAILSERFTPNRELETNPGEPDPWPRLPRSPAIAPEQEPDPELRQHRLNQRLVDQYRNKLRGDLAWEIARAFSRATHVLAAHVEAHANEAFLRTATQWESVRRLVQLIDYRPASASSASTELVIIAKRGRSGTLPKGLQVKYTPPAGGEQVIFETLEPLELSEALNGLRPTGWDRSPEPTGSTQRLAWSGLALESVRVIAGAGAVRSATLDRLHGRGAGGFKVKDMLGPLPAGASERIAMTWLSELRAKARVVAEFELPAGFDALIDWTLEAVSSADPARLQELTGKARGEVGELLERLELLRAVLDEPVYRAALVRQLLPASNGGRTPDEIRTAFCVPGKPRLREGQVAMLFDTERRRGEAARIARLDAALPGARECPKVHLAPSPVQHSWPAWPKSAVRLRAAPRFQRKAWLNGNNVIRTQRPHGFRQGAFVSFRTEAGTLRFAEVLEADDRNLRLRLTGALPPAGTPLIEVRRFEGDKVPPDLEFGLVGAELPQDPFEKKEVEVPEGEKLGEELFKTPGPIVLPSGAFPAPGGLSFGSFLFPSPFLPIDLVKAAVELLLSMGMMVVPSTGKPVFKFLPASDLGALVDKLEALIDTAKLWSAAWEPKSPEEKKAELSRLLTPPAGESSVLFQELSEALRQALEVHGPLLGVSKDAPVKAVVAPLMPKYVCEGNADKLANGDWLVAEFSDGLRALTLASATPLDPSSGPDSFGVTFDGLFGNEGELRAIYADFRAELGAERAALNELPIDSDVIELPQPLPAGLGRGRKLVLSSASGVRDAASVRVTEIVAEGVRVTPAVTGFTRGDLVVHANVVSAGHGAAKPPKRLSSGTEATRFKSVVLEVEDVSTIDDSTFPKGVRADVDVVIDGMRWTQVSSLRGSAPSEPHYVVEATEAGFSRFVFGDGARGRRLPSGTNNVHVAYRGGAGRSGNLAPGSLVKLVNPHWLVETVEQPLPSSRGEELESVEHIRDNAPATLLALARAVSVTDFENLTAERNDIWQAKAFHETGRTGYLDRVRVVVVPAGGGMLDGAARRRIEEFLTRHAVPTVSVGVQDHAPQRVGLELTLRVNEDRYDIARVVERVRAQLTAELSLERRRIGETLFLSSIYYLVESVEGVEDSRCAFRGSAASRIEPETDRSVVYLDPDPAQLVIEGSRYTP